MNLPIRGLSRTRGLALAAAAALTIGTLGAAPAFAQDWYGGAYHHGYSDHTWGYGGYYDGYVGSRGAYNDTPAWSRGYPPGYYPSYYNGYYPGYAPGYAPAYDGYYPYGYAPGPGIGVNVGPVGIGIGVP